MALHVFEKGSRFSENLFQSWIIENAQSFQWKFSSVSYKNPPISKTECLVHYLLMNKFPNFRPNLNQIETPW